MWKFGLLLTMLLVFGGTLAHAQWEFVKAFPDSNLKGPSAGHGIAVDGEGKVWVQPFGATDSIQDANTGNYRATRVLYVFHPDGTPASFSPIKTITVSGVTDTLYVDGRGLRRDHNGDILVAQNNRLYKVNHKTGEGMGKILPGFVLTAPAVSDDGYYYVAAVIPPQPIQIYDETFNLIGNVTDSSSGFSRSFLASPNGQDIYWAGYTLNMIVRYHSDAGALGTYAPVDTILYGISSESFDWDPKTGWLWVSSGNNDANPPNNHPDSVTSYSKWTWYAYDLATNTVVDSIKWYDDPWAPGAGSFDARPRGIAFSLTGDTAYVVQFNASSFPMVQMFVRPGTVNVRRDPQAIPTGYELAQNFPNPFNPSTEIRFAIPVTAMTKLVVYDMLGREVKTLISQELTAGAYTVTFQSDQLSSGTYVYVLTSGPVRLTKKMVLMK